MSTAYEREWLAYQESQVGEEATCDENLEHVDKHNNELEEGVEPTIREIPMSTDGDTVDMVGYDMTGDGKPDYVGLVNPDTGEVDELMPMSDFTMLQAKKINTKKSDASKKVSTTSEASLVDSRDDEGGSIQIETNETEVAIDTNKERPFRIASRESLGLPALMRFSLLQISPSQKLVRGQRRNWHSRTSSSLTNKDDDGKDDITEMSVEFDRPPSTPPPGLGHKIDVIDDDKSADNVWDTIDTIMLDSDGTGQTDVVGYDVTGDGRPDYLGFVNSKNEVDRLLPVSDFEKTNGSIDRMLERAGSTPPMCSKCNHHHFPHVTCPICGHTWPRGPKRLRHVKQNEDGRVADVIESPNVLSAPIFRRGSYARRVDPDPKGVSVYDVPQIEACLGRRESQYGIRRDSDAPSVSVVSTRFAVDRSTSRQNLARDPSSPTRVISPSRKLLPHSGRRPSQALSYSNIALRTPKTMPLQNVVHAKKLVVQNDVDVMRPVTSLQTRTSIVDVGQTVVPVTGAPACVPSTCASSRAKVSVRSRSLEPTSPRTPSTMIGDELTVGAVVTRMHVNNRRPSSLRAEWEVVPSDPTVLSATCVENIQELTPRRPSVAARASIGFKLTKDVQRARRETNVCLPAKMRSATNRLESISSTPQRPSMLMGSLASHRVLKKAMSSDLIVEPTPAATMDVVPNVELDSAESKVEHSRRLTTRPTASIATQQKTTSSPLRREHRSPKHCAVSVCGYNFLIRDRPSPAPRITGDAKRSLMRYLQRRRGRKISSRRLLSRTKPFTITVNQGRNIPHMSRGVRDTLFKLQKCRLKRGTRQRRQFRATLREDTHLKSLRRRLRCIRIHVDIAKARHRQLRLLHRMGRLHLSRDAMCLRRSRARVRNDKLSRVSRTAILEKILAYLTTSLGWSRRSVADMWSGMHGLSERHSWGTSLGRSHAMAWVSEKNDLLRPSQMP